MITYRQLLKNTNRIITSSEFKKYLFKIYRINRNIDSPQILVNDWLKLLHNVAEQQKKHKQLKHDQTIKHYNQNCVLGYIGFVYDPQQLSEVQSGQDLVKLFMRTQMYYLLQKSPKQKKSRLPIYPTLNGYHHSMFLKEVAQKQKSVELQYYNQTIRFQ